MKKMLLLVASEDIPDQEVQNITSQVSLYQIDVSVRKINSKDDLLNAVSGGSRYHYIYLATQRLFHKVCQ